MDPARRAHGIRGGPMMSGKETKRRTLRVYYVLLFLLVTLEIVLIFVVDLETRTQYASFIILTVLVPGSFLVFYYKVALAMLANDQLRVFVYRAVLLSCIFPAIQLILWGSWIGGGTGALVAFILALFLVIVFFGKMNRSVTNTYGFRSGAIVPTPAMTAGEPYL
jgi:hypothetical protein